MSLTPVFMSQRMDSAVGVLGPGLAAAAIGSSVLPLLTGAEAGTASYMSVRLRSTSMTRLWKSWM